MKKQALRGVLAAMAACAVCVPLAACSGGTGTAGTTTTSAEVTTTAEETSSATTSAADTTTDTTSQTAETTTEAGGATQTSAAEISGNTPLDNASVTSDTLKIDVTGYQVYPAGVGGAKNSLNPVVVFYYDVTNLSDKEITALDAWTEVFDAYQNTGEDDRNVLGQGVFVDESVPSQQGTTPLKKDEKASYYKSYQLSDDTTSVTLRSHDGLGGAKLGEDIIVRVQS